MDEDDLKRRVNELDAAVSKEDAKLYIYSEENAAFCEFIANRKGFLRTGIEMLRAATIPLGADDSATPIDLNYLVGKRGLYVRRLIRRENVEPELLQRKDRSWKNKAAGLGCLTILILLAICTFTGIGQVFTWMFGK
jgi:hypothetical protein